MLLMVENNQAVELGERRPLFIKPITIDCMPVRAVYWIGGIDKGLKTQ